MKHSDLKEIDKFDPINDQIDKLILDQVISEKPNVRNSFRRRLTKIYESQIPKSINGDGKTYGEKD